MMLRNVLLPSDFMYIIFCIKLIIIINQRRQHDKLLILGVHAQQGLYTVLVLYVCLSVTMSSASMRNANSDTRRFVAAMVPF